MKVTGKRKEKNKQKNYTLRIVKNHILRTYMGNVMFRNESYLVCATSPLLQAPAVSLAIKIKKLSHEKCSNAYSTYNTRTYIPRGKLIRVHFISIKESTKLSC